MFEKPVAEIVRFEIADIITTSSTEFVCDSETPEVTIGF